MDRVYVQNRVVAEFDLAGWIDGTGWVMDGVHRQLQAVVESVEVDYEFFLFLLDAGSLNVYDGPRPCRMLEPLLYELYVCVHDFCFSFLCVVP